MNSDEQFKLLVDSVKDYAIYITNKDGLITTWNNGVENIKGYTAIEIIGQHISIFYTEEDLNQNLPFENLSKATEYGRYETEGWRKRKDSSVFWANVIFTALYNDGELHGFAKVTKDITDKKKAEDKIRLLNEELEKNVAQIVIENQKILRETLDYKNALNQACIVAITNQKGIITHANENFAKISRYSIDELIGKDHRIINSGHHSKEFIRDLWVTIANGKIWRGEMKNKAKDGTIYWVDTTIVPFLDENEKPYQYLAIRADITTRKKFEEEFIQNEKRFRGMIENSQDIIKLVDNNFKSFYTSPSSQRITGWTDEELYKIDHDKLIHPDDLPDVTSFMKMVLDNPGVPMSISYRYLHKDGHYLWMEATNCNMLHDEYIQGITVNLRNVSERKNAEELLVKSEKIYRTIASCIPDSIICMLDKDHKYILIEGDMLEKLGYSRDKLIGARVEDVVSKKRLSQSVMDLKRVFGGETFINESTINGYDMVTRYVPIKDINNKVFSVMTVGIDVTILKNTQRQFAEFNTDLEDRIAERTEQLELAIKDLESFSYSVSHDLRAPLRAVGGFAKIFEEDFGPQLNNEANRLLRLIRENATKMGVLIDDLLSFAKIGKKEIRKAHIDMNLLTQAAINEASKSLQYVPDIKIENLAPALADPAMLLQALVNLISNALKYSSKKEKQQILIKSEQTIDKTIYSIRDNGAGFNMKYAHKLFGVFQRLHSENEFEGTGVGLAIVHRIISKHGGEVWAQAEVGLGATFYFSLPNN